MADDLFEHPRLAAVYDALDPDRSDLDAYTAIVTELEARCVLDLGCGTGTFALMLAERGVEVVGGTRRARRWTLLEASRELGRCGGCTGMPPRCRTISRAGSTSR